MDAATVTLFFILTALVVLAFMVIHDTRQDVKQIKDEYEKMISANSNRKSQTIKDLADNSFMIDFVARLERKVFDVDRKHTEASVKIMSELKSLKRELER